MLLLEEPFHVRTFVQVPLVFRRWSVTVARLLVVPAAPITLTVQVAVLDVIAIDGLMSTTFVHAGIIPIVPLVGCAATACNGTTVNTRTNTSKEAKAFFLTLNIATPFHHNFVDSLFDPLLL
jgi:hypothetical protein